jgi:predicted Zn-dependent protease
VMGEGLVARLKRGWAEANELNRQKDLAAAIERGRRLLVEHNRQETHEFLEDAMRRFPGDAEFRLLYASNLLAIRPEDAAAEAIKAVELDPEEPILLVRAASLLVGMKHFDSAREYATRARELAPSDFLFMAELIYLEARLATIDGRDGEAEEGFRRAAELEPENEMLALHLARFLANRNRPSEALQVIEQSANQTENLLRLRNELSDEPESERASQG